MSARDWNTGGLASASYSSRGASYFLGYPSLTQNRSRVFTGLMTEWYHVDPGFVDEQPVTYSSTTVTLKSAWMWMDEWDPSNPNWSGTWSDYTPSPVQFSLDPNQLQSFTSHGMTIACNAHEFISGYSGQAVPVTQAYPLNLIVEGIIALAIILIALDLYVYIRRSRNHPTPVNPTYAPEALQTTLNSNLSFCPTCGAKLSLEERYCHNCGRPLG